MIMLRIGTNVVQSVYAKNMLFTQLFKEKAEEQMHLCLYVQWLLVIMNSDGSTKHDFFYVFNNLWSDNADQMSLFYSSSRSLKTDYTR